MAAVYASHSVGQASGDGDVSPAKPTGLAAGDFLLAVAIRGADNSGFNTPTNWTEVGTANDGAAANGESVDVFAKIADSSDAAASSFSFTPTSTDGTTSVCILFRLTNTDGFSSVASSVSASITTSTSSGGANAISISGLTPDASTSTLIAVIADLDEVDVAFSNYAVANNNPSWTELEDGHYDPSGTAINYAAAYSVYSSIEATGNFTAGVSDNGTYTVALVSVSGVENVTVSATPLIATATIPNATISGTANVSVSPLTTAATIPNASVTAQQNTVWTLEDEPDDASWTNENLI